MEKGHNKPPVAIVELDDEMVTFILDNCDANQRLGLTLLEGVKTKESAEKIVGFLEKFKKLKGLVEKARDH